MTQEKKYDIIRISKNGSEVIRTGLTLEEAQAHCSDPSTRKEGVYFDGYNESKKQEKIKLKEGQIIGKDGTATYYCENCDRENLTRDDVILSSEGSYCTRCEYNAGK